ncbi:pepsin/retropepsin-like aspartic protease family protein [Rummeliibacillus pycnus]|uniref:aspartyl protease family protein n=1 Tax=Rummeliibacillus pycnus TaxID=101070 RepID=UPI001FE533BD|nr:aspartyl protease family protein [Rummeliibacillus pycnus]
MRIENGLPIATVELAYCGNRILLSNVLIDTGCTVTIFDTDLMAEIGVIIDFVNGIPTAMYGVGGKGEICNQQKVNNLRIDDQLLDDFDIQLGMVHDMYGFDGIIGIDFMIHTGISLDFYTLKTTYSSNTSF